MKTIEELRYTLREIARVSVVSVEIEDGFEDALREVSYAFDELEELRALTRCTFFALTTTAGQTYAPCAKRAGHAGGCEP